MAQGCVAIKEIGDQSVPIEGITGMADQDKWDLTENYEHFRSYLDFVGSRDNEAARAAATNQVINVVDQFDTSISYAFDPSDTVSLDVPYFTATRSQDDFAKVRYKVYSRGIGDSQLAISRWLIKPTTNPRGNISLGLGLSMPTGQDNAKAYVPTAAGEVLKDVDQSIQPGQGGWGYIFEGEAYYRVAHATSLYASGFYLANPKDTNDTVSNRPATEKDDSTNSVTDQYELRAGVSQQIVRLKGGVLSGSLGGRWEGVPSLDLIGSSDGFRRPGYVLSVEPGLSYTLPHDSFSLSVPVAEYMNRTQSYPDTLTGGHGDAFFAKFLVVGTYSHSW